MSRCSGRVQTRDIVEQRKTTTEAYLVAAHDIECGLLHSALPPCCVAFFVTVMNGRVALLTNTLSPKWRAYIRKAHKKETRYIPCPRCLKWKWFVQPRLCMCQDFNELDKAIAEINATTAKEAK